MPQTPTHIVYHVKRTAQKGDPKQHGLWTKIGAAWAYKDGKGFAITLDLIPYEPRLVLREYTSKEGEL